MMYDVCVFVFQTRVDFTVCNGILVVLAIDLLMFGFFSTFYYSNVLQILYGCLGALVYALVSHRYEGKSLSEKSRFTLNDFQPECSS